MAFTTPRTWNVGEIVTKAMLDEQIRDNENAIWVGSAAGDIDYYTSASTKTRLAKGTAGQILTMNGGATAPSWATPTPAVVTVGSLVGRKGGSATNWYVQGTTNYTPATAKIQVGTVRVPVTTGSGFVSVTYPVAFAYTPVIFLTKPFDGTQVMDMGYTTVTATTFKIYLSYAGTGTINVDVTWLAIGP